MNSQEPIVADTENQPMPDLQTATASPEGDGGGGPAYITALQAEIADLRAQLEEADRRYTYQQAEFQNYRRRKDEESAGLLKYANGEIISSLLPVVDNFERALAAAEQAKSFEALIGGVNGTLKQLHTALTKAGVTPIEVVGQPFDPNVHEAIAHDDNPDAAPNTVTEELQRGYRMHERVLRPALVKVAQG